MTDLGLISHEVVGSGFQHLVVERPAPYYLVDPQSANSVVTIYLDGDGLPWQNNGRTPTQDPTPRNPLALKLMQLDPGKAYYVARPCYSLRQLPDYCSAGLWTSHRYSAQVVESMTAVVNRLVDEQRISSVVLVGYSGGGTLAVLMAPGIHRLKGVITIAANLDTDAWTAYHSYLPLSGSLNPANESTASNKEIHLIGDKDEVVPPTVIERYLTSRPAAQIIHYQEYTHACCWEQGWSEERARLMKLL